jgi:hypothetical protein
MHGFKDIFERPSIDAAYRFKYKPRVIDGERRRGARRL